MRSQFPPQRRDLPRARLQFHAEPRQGPSVISRGGRGRQCADLLSTGHDHAAGTAGPAGLLRGLMRQRCRLPTTRPTEQLCFAAPIHGPTSAGVKTLVSRAPCFTQLPLHQLPFVCCDSSVESILRAEVDGLSDQPWRTTWSERPLRLWHTRRCSTRPGCPLNHSSIPS